MSLKILIYIFFYGGTGSKAKLPTFIPESGSYYSVINIEAKEEARKEKEALAREAEARKEKEAQLAREAEAQEKEDLGEALALIEKMKAEAAERERQLKEANEEAEKKRKNTTSFGF